MNKATTNSEIPDEINNAVDIIDSRNIQKRLDWLADQCENHDGEWQPKEIEEFTEERTNLELLKQEYINSFGATSWNSGAQFIRDSYFEEYARDLADDIGAVNQELKWPYHHIDWESAAEELKMDYTEVNFDGIIFQTRGA